MEPRVNGFGYPIQICMNGSKVKAFQFSVQHRDVLTPGARRPRCKNGQKRITLHSCCLWDFGSCRIRCDGTATIRLRGKKHPFKERRLVVANRCNWFATEGEPIETNETKKKKSSDVGKNPGGSVSFIKVIDCESSTGNRWFARTLQEGSRWDRQLHRLREPSSYAPSWMHPGFSFPQG